jgi:hypothetical protein
MTGCATILQSGPDKIPVRSEPEGATVLLNGMLVYVNRADDCHIDVKKDGYQSIAIDKNKVVAGWVFGNIIFGGIIGLGVDLVTHNQGKYPEEPIFVSLIQKPSEQSAKQVQ